MKKILFFVLLVVVFSFFYYNHQIDTPVSDVLEEKSFRVESGQGVSQIGENLLAADLIKSKFFFKLYIWKNDLGSKLKAGEYMISSDQSIRQIVDVLITGKNFGEERSIKITEGWNSRDIAQYFEREGMYQSEEWLELVGYPRVDYRREKDLPEPVDYSQEYSFLDDKPDYRGLEGYLFPDTYRIFKGSSPSEVLEKMLDNFDSKLTEEMRLEIERQGKTIYEIVTMASIVEKEVRSEADMKIVAGIFWDRIKYGQPLQSCATLAYILGVNKKQYSLEDTKTDSLYNTYQNKGLPPGPIANPGLRALEATIYPEYTDYNYFLSSSDGETIYSVTYDEHLRNKAIYLR
jgi:UPF0755 protein